MIGITRRNGARVGVVGTWVLVLAAVAMAGGAVDTGFDHDGIAVLDDGTVSPALACVGLADGKVLVGASLWKEGEDPDLGQTHAWRLVRYRADGTLDPTFGTGGERILFADLGTAWLHDVARDASGRIVAAGRSSWVAGTEGKGRKQRNVYAGGGTIARLLADGDLDTSFADGGVGVYEGIGVFECLAIDGQGRILVAGSRIVEEAAGGGGKGKKGKGSSSQNRWVTFVARVLAGGALDTTYGDGGFASVDVSVTDLDLDERSLDLAVQSDGGAIVLVGADRTANPAASPSYLVRFAADGTLDTTFGVRGEDAAYLEGLAVDAADRIWASGMRWDGAGGADVALYRYTAGGSRDLSFAGNGERVVDVGADARSVQGGMLIDGDRALLAGTLTPATRARAFAVRVLADGSLDATWGTGGLSAFLVAPDGEGLWPFDAALADDGGVFFAGQEVYTGRLTVGRLTGDGD